MPPEAQHVIVSAEAAPAECGLARQEALAEAVIRGERREAYLLWRSTDALIASFRDTALPRFADARAALMTEGWPVLVRRSGGEAFAIGPGSLQVVLIARQGRRRNAIDAAYESLAALVIRALAALGFDAKAGEVTGAPCSGRYDIAVGDRKVAGLSQRWRRTPDGEMCAATFASLIVESDVPRLVAVINRFYALAGGSSRYRAEAMTSLAEQLPAGMRSDLLARTMQELVAAFDERSQAMPPARRSTDRLRVRI